MTLGKFIATFHLILGLILSISISSIFESESVRDLVFPTIFFTYIFLFIIGAYYTYIAEIKRCLK